MLKGHGRYGVTASSSAPVLRGRDSRGSKQRHMSVATISEKINERQAELATSGGSSTFGSGAGQNVSLRSTGANYALDSMEGILPKTRKQRLAICRDIYEFDSVSGAAVDLMSNLPFSGFTLSGVNDRKVLNTYVKSIESLRMPNLFPYLGRDFLTDGAFVATPEMDDSGAFTRMVTHDSMNLDVKPIPIYGFDPLVSLDLPPEISDLLSGKNKNPYLQKVVDQLPEFMKKGGGGRGGSLDLDPDSTLYVARKSFTYDSVGMSYLHRIIPLWLMEKAFLRGSIEQSYQRQRAITHAVAGNEEWEPTDGELNEIVGLLVSANMDPTGAVIATRPDININEIIRGDDFYKHADVYDYLAQAKMRALNISDSFLSGDATFTTMEVALSVFMEQLRQYRETITREVFYEKLFPAIALANNFKKSARDLKATSRFDSSIRQLGEGADSRFIAVCDGSSLHEIKNIKDITEFHIPKVDWHKQLAPQADRDYIELLASMREQGIPIPVRMMAAAAGLNIDQIMGMLEDDLETRDVLSDHLKAVNKMLGIEDEGGSFASMIENYTGMSRGRRKPRRMESLAEQGEMYGVRSEHKNGKRRYTRPQYQRHLEEAADKKMAEALARLANGQVDQGAVARRWMNKNGMRETIAGAL